MYRLQFNGCLIPALITAFVIFLIFKLWFLVLIIVIIFTLKNTLYRIILGNQAIQKEKEINYQPEKGEVYKTCPYCGINVKRSVIKCPNCEKELD